MRLIIFGPGYVGARAARRFEREGAAVIRIGRDAEADTVRAAIAAATHIITTVAPGDGADPILAAFGEPIAASPAWLGYLSSTGVYGDTGGGWVDESAPLIGRRPDRIAADQAWQQRGACVLRLPGIYGPGRSVLDRLKTGSAHRVDLPEQVFSRIHVDDIVEALVLAARAEVRGVFNIADDSPASQNLVVESGAGLLGCAVPPLVSVETLSPASQAFYAENRRVANGKAKRELGWRPQYSDYQAGLRALIATTSPANASSAPPNASGDQR